MCLESDDRVKDDSKMNTYEKRLQTFKNWPGTLKPEELSLSGFYYLNIMDAVRCHYCKEEIFNFVETDCPFYEHVRLSPLCKYGKIMWEYKKYQNEKNPKKWNLNLLLLFFVGITLLLHTFL